jgi:hypothetical protein
VPDERVKHLGLIRLIFCCHDSYKLEKTGYIINTMCCDQLKVTEKDDTVLRSRSHIKIIISQWVHHQQDRIAERLDSIVWSRKETWASRVFTSIKKENLPTNGWHMPHFIGFFVLVHCTQCPDSISKIGNWIWTTLFSIYAVRKDNFIKKCIPSGNKVGK